MWELATGDLMAAGDASARDPGASRSPLLREENTHHMGPPPRMMPFLPTATLAAGEHAGRPSQPMPADGTGR